MKNLYIHLGFGIAYDDDEILIIAGIPLCSFLFYSVLLDAKMCLE